MTGSEKRPEREIGAIPPDADEATPSPPKKPKPRDRRKEGVAGAGASGGGDLGRLADRKDE